MENNLINKAKYFAQYFRQNVLKKSGSSPIYRIVGFDLDSRKIKDEYSLLLTPLSQITDEDAIEVAKLTYHSLITADWGRHSLFNDIPKGQYKLSLDVADYLRSKGYALPFMGLSVEQLQEYGWLKLKTT